MGGRVYTAGIDQERMYPAATPLLPRVAQLRPVNRAGGMFCQRHRFRMIELF